MDILSEAANHYNCDKGPQHHNYTPVYHKYFKDLQYVPVKLLELGFGGYHYPDRGGAGSLMWADYFLNGKIITTDIHSKNPLNHKRVTFRQGSQDDSEFLKGISDEFGPPDIVVDDASHISALTIKSFQIIFPMLKPGGIYVVEDVHASYWSEHEFDGTTDILDLKVRSTMNYFKMLADGLNYEHLRDAQALMPAFHEQIESIHFYKQLIFILKKT